MKDCFLPIRISQTYPYKIFQNFRSKGVMRILFVGLISIFGLSMHAQVYLTKVNSVWDDRMTEWEIHGVDTSENEVRYSLSLTWPLKRDWAEWSISGEDFTARIRPKWTGDYSNWELRTNLGIISMRQRFSGDLTQWSISQGNRRIVLKTRYRQNANDWIVERNPDLWYMYTEYVDDPRDWLIEDFAEEELSLSLRMAMVFISLWQSIPK